MAIFTEDTKGPLGSISPQNATDASPLGRVEPLLSPELLTSRFLFGIPLVSATRNPITERYDVMTPEMLKDIILGAVNRVEQDTGIDIFPVTRTEKHPWDSNDYQSFGYLRVLHAPIQQLHKLSVTPSNGYDIFVTPLDWVESANFIYGQINIVPMTIASMGGALMAPTQTAGGAQFLNILGMRGWIPAFWQVEYTSGFEEGKIPRVVNDLIGIYAAIEILGQLAASNRQSSFSLSLDGMSQSVATPGPQVYAERLQKLEEQKVVILNKLKAKFGKKLFSSTI